MHKSIKFSQEAWLQPYIDKNTMLKKHVKNDFEKAFFKLINNVVFGKTRKSARKHRDILILAT